MSRLKDNEGQFPADFGNPEVEELPEDSGGEGYHENPEGQEASEVPEDSGVQDNPENPEGQGGSETPEDVDGQDDSENKPPETGGEPGLLAIEEHAEKLKVSKPVFAAVKQAEGWAAGKKVTETEFKTAMDAFLKAPMDGKERPPENGKQEPRKEINNNGTA
jgi:hypothetical protein